MLKKWEDLDNKNSFLINKFKKIDFMFLR